MDASAANVVDAGSHVACPSRSTNRTSRASVRSKAVELLDQLVQLARLVILFHRALRIGDVRAERGERTSLPPSARLHQFAEPLIEPRLARGSPVQEHGVALFQLVAIVTTELGGVIVLGEREFDFEAKRQQVIAEAACPVGLEQRMVLPIAHQVDANELSRPADRARPGADGRDSCRIVWLRCADLCDRRIRDLTSDVRRARPAPPASAVPCDTACVSGARSAIRPWPIHVRSRRARPRAVRQCPIVRGRR